MKSQINCTLVVVTVAILLSFSPTAKALTLMDEKFVCPLCNTKFTTLMGGSGTQFGIGLDLKPLGAIAAPWPVPVCPSCKFVFYKEKFTPEELAECRKIVNGDNYKKNKDRSSHYLIGLLFEGLKINTFALGHIFLKASWQEEGANQQEDLALSLKYFEIYLLKNAEDKTKEPDATTQLLKGELLRRLRQFEKAKSYFTGLKKLKHFQGNFHADVIRYQTQLCESGDSKFHKISEISKGTWTP